VFYSQGDSDAASVDSARGGRVGQPGRKRMSSVCASCPAVCAPRQPRGWAQSRRCARPTTAALLRRGWPREGHRKALARLCARWAAGAQVSRGSQEPWRTACAPDCLTPWPAEAAQLFARGCRPRPWPPPACALGRASGRSSGVSRPSANVA